MKLRLPGALLRPAAWRAGARVLAARWRRNLEQYRDRWLLGASALLLAAALWGPSLPMQRTLYEHVWMLDVTQSMNVPDMVLDGKPAARLAYARHALREALLRLPCGSRVGLGLFTEYRSFLLFTPVEVCAHLTELRSTLDRIDGRMAWTGNSEIAKGLYSGIGIAEKLPGKPALVFVTDGHEAPPVNPRHRPPFNGKAGDVPGVVVGVGGLVPQPIPKVDPAGRPLGWWGADEVMQQDPRSRGRGGSVAGEKMAEEPAAGPGSEPGMGANAGSEHLSSLHEAYLRLLAGETGLAFARLQDTDGLVRALTAPDLARPVPARFELRGVLVGLALLLMVLRYVRRPARGWRAAVGLRAAATRPTPTPSSPST